MVEQEQQSVKLPGEGEGFLPDRLLTLKIHCKPVDQELSIRDLDMVLIAGVCVCFVCVCVCMCE